MIKNNKNVIRKDKTKFDNRVKPTKSQNKITIERNCITSNKPENSRLKPSKTFVAPKNKFNKKITIHNSISSREEIKKKNSPNVDINLKNKLNLKTTNINYSKCISSNIFLSTRDYNCLSKDEKKNNLKKHKSNLNKRNSPKLNNGFKKNFLKKTIIIDNEGNNNLNLNLEYTKKNDYKNILGNKNLKYFNENNENCNSTIFSDNNESNSLFESSVNSTSKILNKINNQKDLKQNIIEKNTEEKRIKEYNKIFNLLNTNIEQFKRMFSNNVNTNKIEDNGNKKIIIAKKNNFKNSTLPRSRNINRKHKIIDYNEKNNHLNLKKNLSEENIKYNKNNNPLYIDIKDNNLENNNEDNNNNKCINATQENNELKNNNLSFLESSIDNDFYKSLVNQTFLENISRISFDLDNNISNKENIANNFNNITNISTNILSNNKKNNIDNNSIEEKNQNKMINLLLNNKNIKSDDKNNYQSYIKYLDKNNCTIF